MEHRLARRETIGLLTRFVTGPFCPKRRVRSGASTTSRIAPGHSFQDFARLQLVGLRGSTWEERRWFLFGRCCPTSTRRCFSRLGARRISASGPGRQVGPASRWAPRVMARGRVQRGQESGRLDRPSHPHSCRAGESASVSLQGKLACVSVPFTRSCSRVAVAKKGEGSCRKSGCSKDWLSFLPQALRS